MKKQGETIKNPDKTKRDWNTTHIWHISYTQQSISTNFYY